ncbi:MAG TPA: crosslink repair DNA glycosylase YcaQ family protein [Jatrophihabitantaceae bacterium]|nr:crosslink repair DNA glycosylase YcaQ family protein [Jatrophihabitantaceae bacterium]
MPHVRREQVIGYRVGAQGLLRDGSSLGKLAVLDFGVQDSGDSARLAFDARLRRTPSLRGVGPGEPLALAWTLRGAPHLHRRADLDWLAAALWPLSDADALGRVDAGSTMKKAGMPGLAGFAAGAEAMRKVVTAPMGKGAASTAVTAATPDTLHRYCRSCQATHVFELIFRMGSLPAGIELEPGTAPPVLVPRPGAVVATSADPAAVQRLIRAYVTLLGPATQGDVAGYLGARRADLASVWPDDLVEVDVEGRPAWAAPERLAALRKAKAPRLVRLLGAFDPYLQARDRLLIVPDKAVHKVLWPILGRPGVLFVDGEVVGTWRPKSGKARLEITVDPFAPLPPAVRREAEREAERVAAVREAPDVRVRWTDA